MPQQWIPKKPNFGPPPPGYVAGLGRGATGFITRTDIGPANISNPSIKVTQIQDASLADNKYDTWSGYKGALFDKKLVDDEDRQAEDAYDFCERRIDERRLKQRQQTMKKQLEKRQKLKNNVPISEQFTDLKRQLAKVTSEQWEGIPEAKDSSIEKRKRDRYVPVPDSMLVGFLNTTTNRVQTTQSVNDYTAAKNMLLQARLDRAQTQVQGKSMVDRVGYLTQLNVSRGNQQMIGDIKKARLLHRSALQSNPKNSDIWLSAARIQQLDGKYEDCRKLLRKGLEYCNNVDDMWIQLARVERAEQSKNVLIQALRRIPNSQKIWLVLADKESHNKEMKSKILRKGLENLPHSLKLWKELIELEDVDEAKKLLYKAVECIPKQIQLWIGLAKLQSYDKAKLVLNKARKANPLNLQIWISAAKLQETQAESHDDAIKKIETILRKGRQILKKNGNVIGRSEWIEQAFYCERSQNLLTCESIVKISVNLGLTEEQLNNAIFKDVQLYENQYQSEHTTRFIFRYGLIETKNIILFERMMEFEKRLQINKKSSQLSQTMQFGIKLFPTQIAFWIAMINKLIKEHNYESAITFINMSEDKISHDDRQAILLKKVQVFKITQKITQARIQLQTLVKMYPNGASVIEYIKFEYDVCNYEEAWKICEQHFKENKSEDMWMLMAKLSKKINQYKDCRLLLSKAVNQFPKSLKLWNEFIQYEIDNNFISRARALINEALMKNPKNENLYLVAIELQLQYGSKKEMSSCLERALKECPKSGDIWGIAVEQEPHNTRKIKATSALKQFENNQNSQISCSVAKVFWKENKVEKARKWLEEALKNEINNGDVWATYYQLMKEKYENEVEMVLMRLREVNEVNRGRKWKKLREEGNNWTLSNEEMVVRVGERVRKELSRIN